MLLTIKRSACAAVALECPWSLWYRCYPLFDHIKTFNWDLNEHLNTYYYHSCLASLFFPVSQIWDEFCWSYFPVCLPSSSTFCLSLRTNCHCYSWGLNAYHWILQVKYYRRFIHGVHWWSEYLPDVIPPKQAKSNNA